MQRPRTLLCLTLPFASLLLPGCADDVGSSADDDDDVGLATSSGGFVPTGSSGMGEPDPTDDPDPTNDPNPSDVPDPTADPTDDPTDDPAGGIIPGLFPLMIEGPEQVQQAPTGFAEMLGNGPTVVVAGSSGTAIVDLADPMGVPLKVEASLGTVITQREGDIWDVITYGGKGGVFANGVDPDGVLEFGYLPFGLNGPSFVTDMRLVERDGEPVIAYAGGTESGLLLNDSGMWTYDFEQSIFIPSSLSVAIPSGDVVDPWAVVSDGTPGAFYITDDPVDPAAPTGNSPRLAGCSQLGTPDWARCGVPDFGDGTVRFFDIADNGVVTEGPVVAPGGNTVRVFADTSGDETVWHMPLFDANALALCTGDCSEIVTVDLPCEGPGHTTVADGTHVVVSCSLSAELWVEEAASVYAGLFD